NFFPGIAGKFGVPLWAYYVSRGQGIISMGVHTKDQAILEFQSFNKALDAVGRVGFRTFLKVNGTFHEPFVRTREEGVEQRMTITGGELAIEEHHPRLGLVTEVLFFPLVESPVPALVRRINFRNRSKEPLKIELLDGLPRIIPYGMDRHCQRTIARHVE